MLPGLRFLQRVSASAVNKYDLGNYISYISTGGGAMLEYLEGKEWPGVKALNEN